MHSRARAVPCRPYRAGSPPAGCPSPAPHSAPPHCAPPPRLRSTPNPATLAPGSSSSSRTAAAAPPPSIARGDRGGDIESLGGRIRERERGGRMSRRSLNPSRRVADGGLPSVGGLFHPKSRSPPVLTIALVVLGVILLIAYLNSGSGVTVSSREAVTRSEGSCTSEVMRALPYLKKAYGSAMQKVLHVGPDSCTVVSNLLKEGKVEAWGVEPYDLEDTDSTCKSLVRKGFVRMSDIKFPLPYRPDSFNLVVVSDALDYLTPRYLNKTLPDLARVSTDGLVIFAGNPGQQKAKVSELPKFGRPAKLRSSSWWTRYFVQTGLTENEGPLKKFEDATSKNKYKPDCQIFHLSSPR